MAICTCHAQDLVWWRFCCRDHDPFDAAAAAPEWVPEPGNLNYSSIYDSGLQKGWNLDTWSSNLTVDVKSYNTASGGNGSAMCFYMPMSEVWQLDPAACK